MSTMYELSLCKRRLLMTAVQSVLLYSAEVWADAWTRVYTERSWPWWIGGEFTAPPLYQLLWRSLELCLSILKCDKEFRTRRWEGAESWFKSNMGGRGLGEIGFYLTQLLSGHAYIRSYIRKTSKALSAVFLYCSGVEHMLRTPPSSTLIGGPRKERLWLRI